MPVFHLLSLRSAQPVRRAAMCLLAAGVTAAFAAPPAASQGAGAASPVQVKSALPTDVMNESVVTVDELIRNENVAALAKARKDAEAAGIIKPVIDPQSLIPTALPPAMMVVSSIAGIESDLRATFNYNGMTYERVRVGAPVGPCRVEAIQPRLVKLARKAKGTPVNQCPSGYWTGFSFDVTTSSVPGAPGAATSMPSPLTGGQAPRPYSSLGAVAAPRVPLGTPDRPVVELVPSRPMGPGQTSSTLTPRQFAPASDLRGASGSSSQPAD